MADSPHDVLREKLANLEKLKKEANAVVGKKKAGRPKKFTAEEQADKKRASSNRYQAEKNLNIREIGPIPPVKDQSRKASCEKDFAKFCKTYCFIDENNLFAMPFSADHLIAIDKFERTIFEGGMFAIAMPRASGKSTLAMATALWAILYGYRRFALLIGATAEHSFEFLQNVKAILETSDPLLEDFPEVCYPIRELKGEAKKQKGQLCEGEPTHIHWGGKWVDLPRVPVPSKAAGSTIRFTGITGRLRGYNIEGKRPDLAIFDDPQSDDSASSDSQNAKRERVLARSVSGLAGKGKRIAAIMPCTVIRPGDMADRILSHQLHPEWDSLRTKLLYEFPTNKALWEEYKRIRHTYDPLMDGDKQRAERDATCFYIERQAEMDAGAKPAWEHRYNDDEVSAVQHAMNIFITDVFAFHSEYQNDPLPEISTSFVELKPIQIAGKTNGMPRGHVPPDVSHITAHIDIQKEVLFYTVCGFSEEFTGYVLDYGSWPDQKKSYFDLNDLSVTLAQATMIQGLEGQLYAGLDALTRHLLDRDWPREGGTSMRIERCLIDARWGDSTDIVYQFCRQSMYSAVLMPSFGKGVGSSSAPLTHREKKPGERFGLNWLVTTANKRSKPHVLYDTNFWKSFMASRWVVAHGNPGCMSLFGNEPLMHHMYADHLTAEYRDRKHSERQGRTVDEWFLHPGKRNDYLDNTIACAVAASMAGASLERVHASTKQKPKAGGRRSWAEMQAKAAGR